MPLHYPTPGASRFGRRFGLGLAVVLGSAGAGLGLATTVSLFAARYNGSAVQVHWQVSNETNLTEFNLSRKLPSDSAFRPLDTVTPLGQLRYTYLDTSLTQGRTGLLPGPVVYRLTVRRPGPGQTFTATVPGTNGPVQRSWGTIKAMFR